MSKERKIDIFSIMRKLDSGNKNIYHGLDKESKKELDSFIGFLALRWMSASDDNSDAAYYVEVVNDIANPDYFKLSDHRELQSKLLAICGARKRVRHCWISPPKNRVGNLAFRVVLEAYPHLKDDEILLWIEQCGRDLIMDMARRLGWQEEELKKLEKELEKQ